MDSQTPEEEKKGAMDAGNEIVAEDDEEYEEYEV